MAYTMTRFKVEDYTRWRQGFEMGTAARQEHGIRGGWIFRNVGDPHEVVLLLEWDDLEHGMRFGQSAEVQQLQQRAGVVGQPEQYRAEEHLSG